MQLSFASGLMMLAAACVASPAPATEPAARAAADKIPGPYDYPGPYDFLGEATGPWEWCAPKVYCQFDKDCSAQEDCKKKAGGRGDLARCGWGVWPQSCWTWT
ncbi:hypothetical protein I7I51_05927 [Histoplasma capsulatum]|uniref:Uncharacterized protein n=1 Tax=Ajellomyces capsulatus TaxID=5037 RepID=A0A8A1MF13_AJECA|nr:predicted protein [Histoplasma mississippiense (nom. inval.)]EDN05559.1 predicted protein [Histoplasma mississippiense (nom. inval.)]QSS65086.1 hypothetical protein I7I51_05927 [Histoplasma capsulatum]